MRLVDDPIRRAFGRTPRELLIITVGVLMVVTSIRTHDTSWNGPVTALVTIAFATRFFAARVAALALCVAALALCTPHWVDPQAHVLDLAPLAGQFALGALLLMSRDLRARFDDTGRGIGPLRNFWRDVPERDRRSIARAICAGAATAAILHHGVHAASWNDSQFTAPWWMTGLVVVAIVAGLLLLAGRAAGFVVAAGFAIATLALLVPRWVEADHAIHGYEKTVHWWLIASGAYVKCAIPAAAVTLLTTLPWLGRLARRSLSA